VSIEVLAITNFLGRITHFSWLHRFCWLPSGKRLHNYGKSPFLMGKSTISMAIFNSYVNLPEGKSQCLVLKARCLLFLPSYPPPHLQSHLSEASRSSRRRPSYTSYGGIIGLRIEIAGILKIPCVWWFELALFSAVFSLVRFHYWLLVG